MKKNDLLFIVLFCILTNVYSQSAEVFGVVTWGALGGKTPDIGAVIYVLDSTKVEAEYDKIFERYFSGGYNYNSYVENKNNIDKYYKKYVEGKKQHEEKGIVQYIQDGRTTYELYYDQYLSSKDETDFQYRRSKSYNIFNDDDWETVKKDFDNIYFNIVNISTHIRGVDKSGKYSIKLKAGTYYVIIQSKYCTKYEIHNIGDEWQKIEYKAWEHLDPKFFTMEYSKLKLNIGDLEDFSHRFLYPNHQWWIKKIESDNKY